MTTEAQLREIFEAINVDTDESVSKTYGLTYVDGKLGMKLIDQAADVYQMIDNIDSDKKVHNKNFDYIAFVTHGWAAPLNKDGGVNGAPSKHPERRRVRLIASVDMNNPTSIDSVLKFADDDELVFDMGQATGSLSEAILGLF